MANCPERLKMTIGLDGSSTWARTCPALSKRADSSASRRFMMFPDAGQVEGLGADFVSVFAGLLSVFAGAAGLESGVFDSPRFESSLAAGVASPDSFFAASL